MERQEDLDDLLKGFLIFRGPEKNKRTVCIKHQRQECLCEVLGAKAAPRDCRISSPGSRLRTEGGAGDRHEAL